jgi:hypothetical protein
MSDLLTYTNDTKKDARRRKTMGDIGEQYACDLLERAGFTEIKNLNTLRANFPLFDIIAKKDDQYYLFTVKARNKIENSTGRINPCYNICALKGSSLKRSKSIAILKELGYPEITAEYHYWITCPIVPNQQWIFYWGSLNKNPKYELLQQSDQYIGVKMSDDYLISYNILGSIDHKE